MTAVVSFGKWTFILEKKRFFNPMNFYSISFILFIISFIIQSADSKGPPILLDRYERVIRVKIGQIARISCPVQIHSKYIINWMKDDDPITSSWIRYSTTGSILRIEDADVQDSGYYVCQAVNGFGTNRATIQLIVSDHVTEELPSSLEETIDSTLDEYSDHLSLTEETLSQPRYLQVTSNSRLQLQCTVAGYTQPDITWLKNGQRYSPHQSLATHYDGSYVITQLPLTFPHISPLDNGNYTCSASNSKQHVNITFSIVVIETTESLPELAGVYPMNTTVEIGATATLQCWVRSETKPLIQWLKAITTDQQNQLHTTSTLKVGDKQFEVLSTPEATRNEDGSYLKKLIIPNVNKYDAGSYMCFGVNTMGYSFRKAYLIVISDTNSKSIPISVMVALPSSIILAMTGIIICWLRIRKKRQMELEMQENHPAPAAAAASAAANAAPSAAILKYSEENFITTKSNLQPLNNVIESSHQPLTNDYFTDKKYPPHRSAVEKKSYIL